MLDTPSINALILAALAGFAMLIGAFLVIITKKRNDKLLSIALGFAAGVMISAAFTALLPEARAHFEGSGSSLPADLGCVLFLALGLLLALGVDRLIPHACGCARCEADAEDISRLGLFSMIAMGLHNLPEGIALFFAGYTDLTLGAALAVAIGLHNITGGITVAMPFYYASGSRGKAILCTLVPALVQPVGALLACLILKQIMTSFVIGMLFAVVAGFLLFIALVELYPTSMQYKYHRASTAAMFVGILLMPLT